MKLELNASEVEAVIDYLYQHARTSPKGKAYKVWQRMYAFILDTAEQKIIDAQKGLTTTEQSDLFV